MRNRIITFGITSLLFLVFPLALSAQPETSSTVSSRDATSMITVMPAVQFWAAAESPTQVSTTANIVQFFGNTRVWANIAQGYVRSDRATFGAITDAQVGVTYRFDDPSLIVSAAANLPTGKSLLSPDELTVASLISSSMFRYRVPVFGQGLNASVSLSYARPLNESSAVGIGLGVHSKGSYEPLQGLNYDPGDEIFLIAGFNRKLDDRTTISIDALVGIYGDDKLDSQSSLDVGSRYALHGRYHRYAGFNELTWTLRLRRLASSSVLTSAYALDPERRDPSAIETRFDYLVRTGKRSRLGFSVDALVTGKTNLRYSRARMARLGVHQTLGISPALSVRLSGRLGLGRLLDNQTADWQTVGSTDFAAGIVMQY